MFSTPNTLGRRAGFTLIELLTVIAIIGILAAIIVPTVGKVRKTAKNAQCVSNLRQWAQAVQLFANDNKGNYAARAVVPSGTNQYWNAISNNRDNMLYGPYLSNSGNIANIRYCPLNENTNTVNYFINRPFLTATGSSSVAPAHAIPLSRVKTPARFMLFTDIDVGTYLSGVNPWVIGTGGLNAHVTPLFATEASDRHAGGANMVFGDGHVQRVVPADILAHGDKWTRVEN